MLNVRRALAITVVAAATLVAPSAVTAAEAATGHQLLSLTGGSTSLALNAATAKALKANGISVAPASEARVTSRGIAFPITGGLINPKTLAGGIKHSGGLTFTAGGKTLTIRDFTIVTNHKFLSAYADQVRGRLVVLNLDLSSIKVAVSHTVARVSNVKATLNGGAARALNSFFGTKLFKAGLAIGTAQANASYRVLYSG